MNARKDALTRLVIGDTDDMRWTHLCCNAYSIYVQSDSGLLRFQECRKCQKRFMRVHSGNQFILSVAAAPVFIRIIRVIIANVQVDTYMHPP